MSGLFHSCRKASELLSRAQDEPLRWSERLRLRVHLSLCADCRKVRNQLRQLRKQSARLFDPGDDPPGRWPRGW